MNFRRGRTREEPEINLIPMIDVLLVILIFLMVTTTYDRYAGLKINLPVGLPGQAGAVQPEQTLTVSVDAQGLTRIDGQSWERPNISVLATALQRLAGHQTDPRIVVVADARASHGAVVTILEAAQADGYHHVTVVTRNPAR